MKTFSNIVIAIMFVFYFFGIAMAIKDVNKDTNNTVTTPENTTTATESTILQDVTISNGSYYYHGEPVYLDEDCSTLLWQLLDSNINYVVPVATYVEQVDGVTIMHLD